MNNKVEYTIENTIKKYDMLSCGDKVLVAVSGGADSMLLLNFLITVRDKYGITLAAAHVEHGIRGEDSITDAEFVEDFCRSHNVEFHLLSINAPEEAKANKIGVEEYSRKRRYEFFNSIECDKIATAHNLTDNVETALFRLARGSGLKGMCGIPPVRDKIIRPLIDVSSAEIREYCNKHNISYRTDATNFDNDYSRNYIRNEIIPSFAEISGDFINNAAAFISDAREDMSFIEKSAEKAYLKCCDDGRLRKSDTKVLDISVAKRVLQKYFSDYNVTLDRVHLNSILCLLDKSGRVQIKGDIFAVADGEFLRFADFSKKDKSFKYATQILKFSEFDNKSVDFYCDCDKIIGKVTVRNRIAGDTINPAGRGCSKSLKKLYNEMKIPPELRENVSVVADEQGVIGVIGYCVDERVKTCRDTKNIFCLSKLPSED